MIVNIMGVAMLAWGLTGLIMWWQLKRLRKVGGIVVVSGVSTIACLGLLLFLSYGY